MGTIVFGALLCLGCYCVGDTIFSWRSCVGGHYCVGLLCLGVCLGALVLHCYYVGGAVLLGALLCRGAIVLGAILCMWGRYCVRVLLCLGVILLWRFCVGGAIVCGNYNVRVLLCRGDIVSGRLCYVATLIHMACCTMFLNLPTWGAPYVYARPLRGLCLILALVQ